MANNTYLKKRPCRICRKWFAPHPRLGDRQKTCGSKECQQKWHAKKCAQWNRQHRASFQATYLSKKLQAAQDHAIGNPPPQLQKSNILPKLPREVIQEVISAQQYVIAEYLSQVLLRSVQEMIREQRADILREVKQLPQGVYSRSNSQLRPP